MSVAVLVLGVNGGISPIEYNIDLIFAIPKKIHTFAANLKAMDMHIKNKNEAGFIDFIFYL